MTKMIKQYLSRSVREYLEWSWNYAIAEQMKEDHVKEVARTISGGILRGEDVIEENLIYDFLEIRVEDFDTMEMFEQKWWEPRGEDGQPTWEQVKAELNMFPGFAKIVEEVKEGRE